MTDLLPSPMQLAHSQIAHYRDTRARFPSLFGHHSDGTMDWTPIGGPNYCFATGKNLLGKTEIFTFWSVHKHAWPMQFLYFFGDAVDSRGERTDPDLTIDIRELGAAIGTNRITQAMWGSKSHIEVLRRALTKGDLAARILDTIIPF